MKILIGSSGFQGLLEEKTIHKHANEILIHLDSSKLPAGNGQFTYRFHF
ncbi:MAG: hypothetical protein WCB15_14645 [Desulfobacterales bacterium]|jgi:hypothetical protein